MNNWRNFDIKQQPSWPNETEYNDVIYKVGKLPSLVFQNEIENLKSDLEEVYSGASFILQAGNCAESFDDSNDESIKNFILFFHELTQVIERCTSKKVIKIGRIAGQFSKPRSSDVEIIDGVSMHAFKGDNINEWSPIPELRTPNAKKLIEGYFHSGLILNSIRSISLSEIKGVISKSNISDNEILKDSLSESEIDEVSSCFKLNNQSILSRNFSPVIYSSHEALILDYEEALTKNIDGKRYNLGAHTLWLGDRTRFIDSAHVEYLSSINNPVGIKIGPDSSIEECIAIIKKINPENDPQRIMLIFRMGINNLNKLYDIIYGLKASGLNVLFLCDPMHGNTYSDRGFKLRSYDSIISEVEFFISTCIKLEVIPSGVHLELTNENVTECIGGGITINKVPRNYKTKVDPRLNASQAMKLCLTTSKFLNKYEN